MTSDELRAHIAERLSRWMRENDVNGRQLASTIGVCDSIVYRWANATSLPRSYELRCLCEATGMSADELLGLER